MKNKIILFMFLATFLVFFTYNQHVEAATLPQSTTTIVSPTNNISIYANSDISINGWAVNKSGIKDVQVIMDGTFLIGAQYNISSPNLNATLGYPNAANSGFISSIVAPSTPGKHTITVTSIGNDGSTSSSDVTINVNALPQQATKIETPTSGQKITSGSAIDIKGWTVNKAGVKNVQVLMDGTLLTGAQYNVSRPDVNNVMPGYPSGDNSGYISSISVPSTAGNHTITVKAIGNDSSTSSANVTINVTALDLSSNIVSYAKKFIGVPYVYGGTTPSGFDCSGFVQYVYGHNGSYEVQLPRTTYDQVNVGTAVAKSAIKPGDLVFFGGQASPYHVGIYIGSNQFIEAPKTGSDVKISNLSVRPDFCAARRIIK